MRSIALLKGLWGCDFRCSNTSWTNSKPILTSSAYTTGNSHWHSSTHALAQINWKKIIEDKHTDVFQILAKFRDKMTCVVLYEKKNKSVAKIGFRKYIFRALIFLHRAPHRSFDHGTFHIFLKHVYISQQFVSDFFKILYVFRFFIPTETCEFGTPPYTTS